MITSITYKSEIKKLLLASLLLVLTEKKTPDKIYLSESIMWDMFIYDQYLRN